MDPIGLDDLPDDLRASLEDRARAQGLAPSAYVLELVLRDLGATMWALPTRKLAVPAGRTPALVSFVLRAGALAKATTTVRFGH
jgi:hypothetical protein